MTDNFDCLQVLKVIWLERTPKLLLGFPWPHFRHHGCDFHLPQDPACQQPISHLT